MSLFIRFFTFFSVTFSSALFSNTEVKPDLTIHIPMRDGLTLPTDIYLPYPEAKNLPCILVRAPTGRERDGQDLFFKLLKHNYIVAIQETRSFKKIDDNTFPYTADGWGELQDGYDTIEWLAKSSYTNGKIGTIGRSAFGITQNFLAPTAPKGLTCQYIEVAVPNLFKHAIFPCGKFRKDQVEGWLSRYGKKDKIIEYLISQKGNPDFWSQFDATLVSEKIQAPALHIGGWYDTFIEGTIEGFISRQYHGGEGAKSNQRLVIGPWHHLNNKTDEFGDFVLPKNSYDSPFDISPEAWFDIFLKESKKLSDLGPIVSYYVMGPFDGSTDRGNVWKHADHWPIPSETFALYLTKQSGLRTTPESSSESILSFDYDPFLPVPTIGGNNLFIPSGPKDQRPIESRDDVCIFTSPPLEEELEITGNPVVKLFISSSKKRGDVAVRLTDVYPDGKSILICDGITEGNHLKDTPKELKITLLPTSYVFAKGHQIRISISNSNFPRYEKFIPKKGISTDNLNQRHAVHLGKGFLSRLELPLIRKGDRILNPNCG